eukprot:jgi/Undpi1/6526/HiC_scaffold_20.g09005.m1
MKALLGHVVDRGLSLARSSVLLALLGNGDALAVVGTPPPTSVIVTAPCAARGFAPGRRSVASSHPRCRTSGTTQCNSISSSANVDNVTTHGGSSDSGGLTPPGPGDITPPLSSASAAAPGGNPLVAGSRRTEDTPTGDVTRTGGAGAGGGGGGGGGAAVLAKANRTERGQRLRALNWVKQVRNELTSAEFALNLNGKSGSVGTLPRGTATTSSGGSTSSRNSGGGGGGGSGGGGKSEIDYDSIAERLEASLRTLQAGRPLSLLEAISQDELQEITERLKVNLAKIKKITQAEGRVKGDWRAGKASAKDGKGGAEGEAWRDAGGILDDMKEGINVNLKDVKVPEFDLFVRDDGTVDWDGAIQSGREVARFALSSGGSGSGGGGRLEGCLGRLWKGRRWQRTGEGRGGRVGKEWGNWRAKSMVLYSRRSCGGGTGAGGAGGRLDGVVVVCLVGGFEWELWDRINGQNPHEEGALAAGGSHGGSEKPAKELPEDSSVMLSLSAVGAELESRQGQLQKELDALKADARAQEASWQGLDRRNAQRAMREKEAQVNHAKRQLQLHRIDVDMERICYYVEQEIRESTATSLSEYRLLVAEFGLLDAQLANLTKLVAELTGEEAEDGVDGLVIDEDELELVSREVLDLKNRLGLDLENPAFSVDPEKVSRYVKETYEKIKDGLSFYWTGTKILGSDVGYALTLVTKAAQGSILKPREVRTLRRTAKDCVTFIPFMIILIIPLSPVGHVLVFSFIQRFFPDFFPSTYTDRRQNLLKMYTEVEKKVDWEEADPADNAEGSDDILENLRRNFIATLNQAGDQVSRGQRCADG